MTRVRKQKYTIRFIRPMNRAYAEYPTTMKSEGDVSNQRLVFSFPIAFFIISTAFS